MKKTGNLLLIGMLSALMFWMPFDLKAQQKKPVKKQSSVAVEREAQKIRRGVNQKADASMNQLGVQTKETQSLTTPDEALKKLKEGNARFVADKMVNQKKYRAQVPLVAKGQFPFAAILSCIDSRSSVEDLFDLNNGDAFNARIAGNIVNDDVVGSFEFATKVMNAKLIVVMGHTSCGAIYGACDNVKLGSLTGLLDRIEPAIQTVVKRGVARDSKNKQSIEDMTIENVRLAMAQLPEKSPIIKDSVDKGNVKIVGALYYLETGKVRFME